MELTPELQKKHEREDKVDRVTSEIYKLIVKNQLSVREVKKILAWINECIEDYSRVVDIELV